MRTAMRRIAAAVNRDTRARVAAAVNARRGGGGAGGAGGSGG